MNPEILKELQKITSEEQTYLDRHMTLASDDLYFSKNSNKVESHRFLDDQKLLTVRPHTRFVEFGPHSHNYIEMMYVCQGSITHIIGEHEIILKKGDFLVMNQHVEHAIRAAGYDDVAINFIARQEFFDIPQSMVGSGNAISEFLLGILRTKDSLPHYLHFRLDEDWYIETLTECIIASIVLKRDFDERINQYMMGIVFLHLLRHVDGLTKSSSMDYHELLVQSALRYIDTRYQTAQLARFADETHQNVSVLSRLIRQKTGTTFQEVAKSCSASCGEQSLRRGNSRQCRLRRSRSLLPRVQEEIPDNAPQVPPCHERQQLHKFIISDANLDRFSSMLLRTHRSEKSSQGHR